MAKKDNTIQGLDSAVTPSAIIRMLPGLLSMGTNALIVGSPGIGKTDIIRQVADTLGADLIISHLAIESPINFKGMPAIIDGEAVFLPFENLKKLMTATNKLTIFFMDDFGQAPDAVQAAAMQLLQGGEIDGKKVSDKVRFVAATNRRADRAGVSGILAPVMDRFCIINMRASADDWCEWAADNRDRIHVALPAYVRWKPQRLEKWEPQKGGVIANSFTPRGLERVSQIMLNPMLQERDWHTLFAGCIGEASALELKAFIDRINNLPTPQEIMADPQGVPVPTRLDAVYGMIGMLVGATNGNTVDTLMQFVERLAPEFQTLYIKDVTANDVSMYSAPSIHKWTNENTDLFINLK